MAAMKPVSSLPDANDSACVSCGAVLQGPYCSQCGEKRLSPEDASLREVFAEWQGALSHTEGKLLKTLRLLLFRPGFLTREYFQGRRVPYVRPAALFLTVNVLYFFLSLSLTFSAPLWAQIGETGTVGRLLWPQQPIAARLVKHAIRAETFSGSQWNTLTQNLASEELHARKTISPDPQLAALVTLGQQYLDRAKVLTRFFIVVLIPVFATLMWIPFLPVGGGWLRQLIYATHFWTAYMLISVAADWLMWGYLRLSRFLDYGGLGYQWADTGSALVILGLLLVYLFFSLREFWRWSWGRCAAFAVWGLVAVVASVTFYRTFSFFVTWYSLKL